MIRLILDLKKVKNNFKKIHSVIRCNKATGLPIQLDLTDQDITIPAGFTREFVEEIEARLTKDSKLDMYEIENHFGSLNPQKQE